MLKVYSDGSAVNALRGFPSDKSMVYQDDQGFFDESWRRDVTLSLMMGRGEGPAFNRHSATCVTKGPNSFLRRKRVRRHSKLVLL